MTELNDKFYTITKTGDDTFTLNGVDSSGFSTWTTGGSVTKGAFYVAKEATAMKAFTSGNSGATDHWGATGVAAMMDVLTPAIETTWGTNGVGLRYGNSTNQVLEEETSGNAWLLTGLGLPKAGGMSASGSSLFGLDGYIQYIIDSVCVSSGSGFDSGSNFTGVWYIDQRTSRTGSFADIGFRCAYYPA
jgi:hypothetical protein